MCAVYSIYDSRFGGRSQDCACFLTFQSFDSRGTIKRAEMENKNEEEFDVFLSEKFLTGKNSGSKTITKSKGEVIVKMLKGGDGKDPKLKFWIKNKGFRLMPWN